MTTELRLPWHRETVGHASTRKIADKVLADLNVPIPPDNFAPSTDATWIINAGNKVVAFVGNGPRQTDNADTIIEAMEFMAEVREARENGYDTVCAECGTGIATDGMEMHVTGCTLGAN